MTSTHIPLADLSTFSFSYLPLPFLQYNVPWLYFAPAFYSAFGEQPPPVHFLKGPAAQANVKMTPEIAVYMGVKLLLGMCCPFMLALLPRLTNYNNYNSEGRARKRSCYCNDRKV